MCRVHIRHLRLTGILVSPLRRGSFSRSFQMGLTVKASPMLQLDVNAGDVPATPVKTTEYISIRCVMAFYGFRPYGGSLLSNSHKSKQKGLAPAYGPRFAQVSLAPVPLRGHAVTGHPWPNTALPASMPEDPLRRTSTRPAEGAGRSRADQKPKQSKAKQSKAKQSKAKQSKAKQSKAKQSKAIDCAIHKPCSR